MMFTFRRIGAHLFDAITPDGKLIAHITTDHSEPGCFDVKYVQPVDDEIEENIHTDFNHFLDEPENTYGNRVDVYGSAKMNAETYCALIIGYFRNLYKKEEADEKANRCITWLESTDFFSAPASTQYHDSCDGGLVQHSLTVYNKMVELLGIASFCEVDWRHALLTALVHDWCKIGLYERFMKNVKNEATGAWEQVVAFRHAKTQIPLGHGTASMFMAERFFKLSTEQALAIRWHMGVYQVAETEKPDLFRSNESYPMVYLLQFADQLSITTY